jgi:hypothetical protein
MQPTTEWYKKLKLTMTKNGKPPLTKRIKSHSQGNNARAKTIQTKPRKKPFVTRSDTVKPNMITIHDQHLS